MFNGLHKHADVEDWVRETTLDSQISPFQLKFRTSTGTNTSILLVLSQIQKQRNLESKQGLRNNSPNKVFGAWEGSPQNTVDPLLIEVRC